MLLTCQRYLMGVKTMSRKSKKRINGLTTYDEIFQCFMDNCEVSAEDIPSTNDGKYAMIKNAVKFYNSDLEKYKEYFQANIKADNTTEKLDYKLNDNELLILAYEIKVVHLKNKLMYFTQLYTPFTKELGQRNHATQLKGREAIVKQAQEDVVKLINNKIYSEALPE